MGKSLVSCFFLTHGVFSIRDAILFTSWILKLPACTTNAGNVSLDGVFGVRAQEVSAGASEGSRRHRRRRRGRDNDALSLISLFVPISLCMLLVVVTVNTVASSYAAPPRRHACVSLPSVSRAVGKSPKSRQLAEEKLAKIAVKSRRSIFVVIYCPKVTVNGHR